MIKVKPIEWHTDHKASGQSQYGSAFGIDRFYFIVGEPGAWTLMLPGPKSMINVDGLETQESARKRAQYDLQKRINEAIVQ